ncbi:MAG: NAD(+)/NADH kinase, partial [Thermoleophilia bacterium]|nr:NAD(+)/NADH kinase [Thermoleophilia bacterium]
LPFTTLALGTSRVLQLPALVATINGVEICALNDVVASGGVTGRIMEVGWRIVTTGLDGLKRVDDMGVVPCDGMVLATPVGSTAYNLSNGGPVIAWGVDGYVVSFIAPHTLAARPLVVSALDGVELEHGGRGAALKIFSDGQEVGELGAGDIINISLDCQNSSLLAVVDDHSFYTRYRDSFAAAASDHVRRPRSTPAPPNSVRGSQP